jgi:hypothetical protein
MRPIIRTQFILEVLEMETDSCRSDRELICNLLVAVTISNEPEHLQLPSPKFLLAKVFRRSKSVEIGRFVHLLNEGSYFCK